MLTQLLGFQTCLQCLALNNVSTLFFEFAKMSLRIREDTSIIQERKSQKVDSVHLDSFQSQLTAGFPGLTNLQSAGTKEVNETFLPLEMLR